MVYVKFLTLSLLGLVLLEVATLVNAISISSQYDVTQLTMDDKNAGTFVETVGDEANDVDESIRWGTTAQQRGSQLQLITQALQDLGDVTAAQSMLSLSSMVGNGTDDQNMLLAETAGSALQYYEGPVLNKEKKNPLKVYLIFYGKQWTDSDKNVVETFVKALNPAVRGGPENRTLDRWWDITTKYYYDWKNRPINSNIVLQPSIKNPGSMAPYGSKRQPLKDKHIKSIITRAIGTATPSRSSVYFVLTSPEVYVKNFGTVLCTYHSSYRLKKVNVAYSFVGNPATQALSTCSYKYYDPYAVTRNGLAIDAVVNWMAHSMTKMATNPYPQKKGKKGWVVAKSGIENADLCAWVFGFVGFTVTPPSTFYTYNLQGGGKNFLIQTNFNPKIKKCVIIGHNTDDKPIPFPNM